MICIASESEEEGTYIEEEAPVDRSSLAANWVRQVLLAETVAHRPSGQRGHIELFEPRHVDHVDLAVAHRLLAPSQYVPQELERAVVEWRKVELALNS